MASTSLMNNVGRIVSKQSVQLAGGLSGTLISRSLSATKPASGPSTKTWPERDRAADQKEFDRLIEGNQEWREAKYKEDPEYFKRMAHIQTPKYLWIGCSDSRVPAETLTGTNPGDLFVHRNVANLVVNTDMNMLSVLTYAVEHLKVKHIVVCGHYNCGGVRAANATDVDLGVIEHWLRNVRDVKRLHMAELNSIVDDELRHRRLVELNVAEACINLFKTGVVQETRMKTGYPLIHGLVYDLADGHLNTLNLDLLGYMRQYKDVYKLYQ